MNKAKPFGIPKREVWEAFKHVKANQGAAGIDGQSVASSRLILRYPACRQREAQPGSLCVKFGTRSLRQRPTNWDRPRFRRQAAPSARQ
jgi:hypothetical protein